MWWTHRWRYDSEALGIHSVAKELVNLDNEHRVEGDATWDGWLIEDSDEEITGEQSTRMRDGEGSRGWMSSWKGMVAGTGHSARSVPRKASLSGY